MSNPKSTERVILRMRRIIPAPREAVFKAWTDPDLIRKWWCGPGCAVNSDLRSGGAYGWSHKDKDGSSNGVFGTYLEIDSPRKLVFTFNWEGDDGPGTTATVEFFDAGGKTEIVLTHDITENANACEEGWGGCLDRMEQIFAQTV